jgi:hypothetical protein
VIGRLLVALALILGGSQAAWGQSLIGPGKVEWSKLAPAQRAALAPLERDWANISAERQQKWLDVANRFGSMPPDERARSQQRMAEWASLPPQERARARLNFQEARQLSSEERQRQWEAYRSLTPDQRRALAERNPAPASGRNGRPTETQRSSEKSNLVRAPAPTPARTVGPTVVQRGGGATTNLVSKPAQPPLHQQAGLPKVAATPGFVDAETLLPQRGAQGAATRPVKRDSPSKSGGGQVSDR